MKCDVPGCPAFAAFKTLSGACYCYSCAGVRCAGRVWTLEPIATPDMFGVAARHVGAARREEHALNRLLDNGRFGAVSAADPWPGHDAALARDMVRETKRSWLFAALALIDALKEGP